MSTNTQTATPAIDITKLTTEQLAALRKALKANSSVTDHKQWNTVVDAMLQGQDATGFKHTTGDILAAVVAKKLMPKPMDKNQRAMAIKRIQTRKQLLEKKVDETGKKLFKVGYKPSENGLTMGLDRVLAWLDVATNEDRAAVAKHLGRNK